MRIGRSEPAEGQGQSEPAEGRSGPGEGGGGPLLEVSALNVVLPGGNRPTLRGIDLVVPAGSRLGVAGEPRAGTTTLLRALIGLLPADASVHGSIRFGGVELLGAGERQWRAMRGRHIAVVFADPQRSLDSTIAVGPQIAEAVRAHERLPRAAVRERIARLLDEVEAGPGIASSYPHLLSGDEGRRVMLASALASGPSLLLVEDDPAPIDPARRRAFLSLLGRISAARQMATVVMSHDVAALDGFVDEIAVLCGGLIVEQAPPSVILDRARVPYTRHLLATGDQRDGQAVDAPSTADRSGLGRSRRGWRGLARPRRSALPHLGFGLFYPPVPLPARERPGAHSAEHLLVGCSYSLRCPRALEACAEHEPPLVEHEPGHAWACWNAQVPEDDRTS